MANLVLTNTFFHVWVWMCVMWCVVNKALLRVLLKRKKKVILDSLLSEAIHSQDTGAIIFSVIPIIFTSIVSNFDRLPLNFPTDFCKVWCFVSPFFCNLLTANSVRSVRLRGSIYSLISILVALRLSSSEIYLACCTSVKEGWSTGSAGALDISKQMPDIIGWQLHENSVYYRERVYLNVMRKAHLDYSEK